MKAIKLSLALSFVLGTAMLIPSMASAQRHTYRAYKRSHVTYRAYKRYHRARWYRARRHNRRCNRIMSRVHSYRVSRNIAMRRASLCRARRGFFSLRCFRLRRQARYWNAKLFSAKRTKRANAC